MFRGQRLAGNELGRALNLNNLSHTSVNLPRVEK